MTETKPRRIVRLAWLGLYAVLCAAEFVIDKLKDFVEEHINPDKKDKDEDDGDDK